MATLGGNDMSVGGARRRTRLGGRRVSSGSGVSESTADLATLYADHYRSLVKLASFYVDDRESAEEVTQDAFVKLLGGSYRIEPGREAAYLRSAVLNGARSSLRKRRVRRAHIPDRPGVVAAAEVGGVQSAEQARIVEALRQLPERQAAVLVLRYYLDLSEAQIADTLGVAKGSVKSHNHRGLAKLADLLGEEPPETFEDTLAQNQSTKTTGSER